MNLNPYSYCFHWPSLGCWEIGTAGLDQDPSSSIPSDPSSAGVRTTFRTATQKRPKIHTRGYSEQHCSVAAKWARPTRPLRAEQAQTRCCYSWTDCRVAASVINMLQLRWLSGSYKWRDQFLSIILFVYGHILYFGGGCKIVGEQ